MRSRLPFRSDHLLPTHPHTKHDALAKTGVLKMFLAFAWIHALSITYRYSIYNLLVALSVRLGLTVSSELGSFWRAVSNLTA